MNLPGVAVSAPSITEKDRADIAFAVEQQLDYLALSFVRRAEDIIELRELIPTGMLVVAKIEKDTALAAIGSIVEASDAVMVARGDLGVELPFEEVPIAQKRIIAVCNAVGRPVITATQMLESMIMHPRPTRAEASDVANAILDGTDAVMLSAETAAGAYPRLAVSAMTRIIIEIERRPLPHVRDRGAARRARPRVDRRCDRRRDHCRCEIARRAAGHRVHEERLHARASSRRTGRPCPMLVLTDSASARIVSSRSCGA